MDLDFDSRDLFNHAGVDDDQNINSPSIKGTRIEPGTSSDHVGSRPSPAATVATPFDVTSVTPQAHSPTTPYVMALEKLYFLSRADWDENNSYDEQPPSCLHYSIECKIAINGKVVSRDTETDVVLNPAFY